MNGTRRAEQRRGVLLQPEACHSAVPSTHLIKQACGMVWQLPGCISTCLVVYAGLRQDGCGTSGSLSQLVPGMFVLTVS